MALQALLQPNSCGVLKIHLFCNGFCIWWETHCKATLRSCKTNKKKTPKIPPLCSELNPKISSMKKKYPAESPSFTRWPWQQECARGVPCRCTPSSAEVHRGQCSSRCELGLKLCSKGGRKEQRRTEDLHWPCSWTSVYPDFQHLLYFTLHTFSPSLSRWLYLAMESSPHWRVLTLLESSFTKHIIASSNIKKRFINTIFLQVLS